MLEFMYNNMATIIDVMLKLSNLMDKICMSCTRRKHYKYQPLSTVH